MPLCSNLPHNIAIHPDLDKLIVCDRENNRVQLFTLEGEFISSWFSHRACGVHVSVSLTQCGHLRNAPFCS